MTKADSSKAILTVLPRKLHGNGNFGRQKYARTTV